MDNFEFHRLVDGPLPTPRHLDVPPAVFGVLTILPAPGTQWPDVEKAKFLSALGHVLDLVYPSHDHVTGVQSDSQGEKPNAI